MKKKTTLKGVIAAIIIGMCAPAASAQYTPSAENQQSRKEFQEMRFGIFIHWGIYSMFGQGEWFMSNKKVRYSEYSKAASAFYPHEFNAKEWVTAIKGSGAKYICFTSRHHDGFSMFATKQSKYNIVDATPYGKDIVKQLADECHAQGVKLNLYYSLLDWGRPDYPLGSSGTGLGKEKGTGDMRSYVDFMKGQLTELLSNYGKIGAIWFDGWWDHNSKDEKFDWHLPELYTLIHKLQPACLVANNHHVTPFDGEDIQTFERDVPGENKAGYSAGQKVSVLPLETCQTMNTSWGYDCTDYKYKSLDEIVKLLARTAGKGANLLLNIGPQPNGRIPAEALKRLKEIGQWMSQYGETIYGTTATETGEQKWGTTTQKGKRMFLHVINPDSIEGNEIKVPLKLKAKKAFVFIDKKPLKFKKYDGGIAIALPEKPTVADYIIEVALK